MGRCSEHLREQRPAQRANVDLPDDAVTIDEKGGGQSVDAVGLADLAVLVQRRGIGEALLRHEGLHGGSRLALVNPDHRYLPGIAPAGALQLRRLATAGRTPGRPEVEHHRPAAQGGQAEALSRRD